MPTLILFTYPSGDRYDIFLIFNFILIIFINNFLIIFHYKLVYRRFKKLAPWQTKPSPYPVTVLAGQFSTHYKKYSTKGGYTKKIIFSRFLCHKNDVSRSKDDAAKYLFDPTACRSQSSCVTCF